MTLQQVIYKSTHPHLWHPLLVSLSLSAIDEVGLGWCLKEYSKQCEYSEDGFQREFCRIGHNSFPERCFFDSFVLSGVTERLGTLRNILLGALSRLKSLPSLNKNSKINCRATVLE